MSSSAALSSLAPIRPGHPLYACRPKIISGDLMYGVSLINQVRSQALLYWIHGKDAFGRDFLPAWDTSALRVSKSGNVVVWEKQTENQGKQGVSARILVEEESKWVMQVWPNEGMTTEEWAPFTSLRLDPRLLNHPSLEPRSLGHLIQHCFRSYFGKSVRVEIIAPHGALKEGNDNPLRILIWDIKDSVWLDIERLAIRCDVRR